MPSLIGYETILWLPIIVNYILQQLTTPILQWFIVVKTVKDGPKKNRQTNYDSNICSLTTDHLLFNNFVFTFQISTDMTFEFRPRQRSDYRSLHSGEKNQIW